jgi:hypothetical protein
MATVFFQHTAASVAYGPIFMAQSNGYTVEYEPLLEPGDAVTVLEDVSSSYTYEGVTADGGMVLSIEIDGVLYGFAFGDSPFTEEEPFPAFTATTFCFLAGTLIATPTGAVPVETLAIGDPILTADGRTVPVKWLGRQTLSTRFGLP